RNRVGGTIALAELLRIRERLDRAAELLGRDQVQVLDVVRVLRVGLSAGRSLGDGGESVPGETGRVGSRSIRKVEDTVVDTGLIEALADLVPNELGHDLLLLV